MGSGIGLPSACAGPASPAQESNPPRSWKYLEAPMDTSKSLEKALTVMELLQEEGAKTPLTLDRLVRRCGVPKTTVLRILTTLVSHGYASKTNKKRYVANFQLTKMLPLDSAHHQHLEGILAAVSREAKQAAEIITATGKSLYWYDRAEPPDLSVRIVAERSFKRTLYELDAPARLYLRYYGKLKIQEQFDTSGFYTASPRFTPLTWEEAWSAIEAVDPQGVTFDRLGNRNGIRRFATAITSKTGDLLYMLCIAEPAMMKDDLEAHVAKIVGLLGRSRRALCECPQVIQDPESIDKLVDG